MHNKISMKEILKNEKINRMILAVFLFVFFFVFFSEIHPLSIFDTDDWRLMSVNRTILPSLKAFNPTRVFPEVFGPIVQQVGHFLLYPIIKDFIKTNIVINAIVASFFITLYFVTFFKLISNKFKLKKHTAFFVLALFILMHFWIFRCQEEKNTFMFATVDVCCLYYYIVSNMVNATIVMKLINNDFLYGSIKEKNSVKTGLVLVAVYFALFSNLYASIILAVYIGTQLLVEFFNVLKNKNFLETLKNNIIRLIYIFSWAAMQLFEMNGTRAKSLEKGSSILELIKENLKEFWKIKNKVNGNFKKYVLVIFVFFILCIIVTYITKKELKKENVKFLKEIFFLVFPLVISATYLIIVSAKHYIGSIARPDINFGIVFYGFIILFYMICYLVNKIQFTNIILPIFLIAILFDIDTTERTFSVYYYNGPTDQKRIEISDDIVDQIIEADKNGTEMTLYVPKFNDGDNWPIATYAGNDISRTLYKYGIINYYINVNMVPTEDKNVELGLY